VSGVGHIWGRFIIDNDPTLPASVIQQITTVNGSTTGDNITAAEQGVWPSWEAEMGYKMLNLNMTGGVPSPATFNTADASINITRSIGPGIEADFAIVDAWSWEGGRGERCDFWKQIGALVPE
jgi:hypothetical protein